MRRYSHTYSQSAQHKYASKRDLQKKNNNVEELFSARIPNAPNRSLFTSHHANRLPSFGFAGRTGVFDFFAMLLRNRGNKLVLQINKLCLHLQGVLGAPSNAYSAAVAFLSVYDDVEFA